MKNTLIDHLTITAPTLEAGAKLVEEWLGFTPQKGGKHPRMGTHNLFLRLGDSIFLEIIACDPKAEKPDRPRWFALDEMTQDSQPQLRTWVLRTEDIQSMFESASESVGEIEPMSRGETNWLITIPKDGSLPLDGAAPALIQWQVAEHPATKLIDYGLSLSKLQVFHPEPDRLTKFLASLNLNDDVEVIKSDESKLVATINTPKGVFTL